MFLKRCYHWQFFRISSIFLLVTALAILRPHSAIAAEPIEASLVITGPGDAAYSYWGHTGLLVKRDDGLSRFYDFGNFSFLSDNFFTNFAMGKMIYIGLPTDIDSYVQGMVAEDRDSRVIPLNFEKPDLIALEAYLKWRVDPNNREYLYHYFLDNCATIIRDIIDQATNGTLREATQNQPSGTTYRELSRIGASPSIGLEVLLHYLLGPENDIPISRWDQMFLPESLGSEVQQLKYLGTNGRTRSLAAAPLEINTSSRRRLPSKPRYLWPKLLLLSILLGMGSVIERHYKRRWFELIGRLLRIFSMLVVGIPGVLLTFLMFFTDHTVVANNLNILMSFPVILIGIVPALQTLTGPGSPRSEKFISILWTVNLGGVLAAGMLRITGIVVQDIGAFLVFFGLLSLLYSWPWEIIKKRINSHFHT